MFGLPEIPDALLRGIVLTAAVLFWTILMIRIVGLRALSKMSAFDFVATIATGSLIAQGATRSDGTAFAQTIAALAAVFLVQSALAVARGRSPLVREIAGNAPMLLVENGRFIEAALAETRVTRDEVLENLRAKNVSSLRRGPRRHPRDDWRHQRPSRQRDRPRPARWRQAALNLTRRG